MKNRILATLALIGFVAMSVSSAHAGPQVIVNNDAGVSNVSSETVKNVFLGKTTKLDNGTKVTFAVLKGGSAHESFLNDVVGKSPSQFLSYWRKLAFSGKGSMPQEFDSEDALVAYVQSTPGAIGYVSEGTATDGVTVVSLD